MINLILVVGLLLSFKHFVFDGPLQKPYQYLNKGKFLHPGGLLHAGLHGLGTFLSFLVITMMLPIHALMLVALMAIVDTVIHYFVDWTKVNLTTKYKWSHMQYFDGQGQGLVITSDNYFIALMADQCLHFATYIFLIWLFFTLGITL